jgi:amino acid permease
MIFMGFFALVGAILGWRRGGRNDGERLDRLQYAAVFGIIGGLIGLALLMIIGPVAP